MNKSAHEIVYRMKNLTAHRYMNAFGLRYS